MVSRSLAVILPSILCFETRRKSAVVRIALPSPQKMAHKVPPLYVGHRLEHRLIQLYSAEDAPDRRWTETGNQRVSIENSFYRNL
jgi:hypothetical protein